MRITGFALVLVVLAPKPAARALPPAPPPAVDWEAQIPAIRETLKAEAGRNPDFRGIEEQRPIGIAKVADVTGHGDTEALVYLGTGGASTDEITLMRIVGDKPVLALFGRRHEKVMPMIFAEGASVMHSNGVQLLGREHAVFSIHYSYDGNTGRLHECGGEAYSWNSHTLTFDYNPRLTKKLTETTCRQVPQTPVE